MSTSRARSSAERVTFAVACFVLGLVVVLILGEAVAGSTAARPAAEVTRIERQPDGRFFVAVEVGNLGGDTAAEVQVTAALELGGRTTQADQTIDFLAGHETRDLVFVFDDDPEDGDLVVAVSGFAVP